jgi:hypothetical protein
MIVTRAMLLTFRTGSQRSMALQDLRMEQDLLQFVGNALWNNPAAS